MLITLVSFPAERTNAVRRAAREGLFLTAGIRGDNLAGSVLCRFEDDFGLGVAELVDAGAGDILPLHLDHPRLRPFAVIAKGNRAKGGRYHPSGSTPSEGAFAW